MAQPMTQPQEMKPLIVIGVVNGKVHVAAPAKMSRAELIGFLGLADISIKTTPTPNGSDIPLADPNDPGTIQVPSPAEQKILLAAPPG
jgi:hypothetical protein